VNHWPSLVAFSARNWFWGWTFFLPGFVLELLSMFTAALTFYVMGTLVAPGAAAFVAGTGLDYGAYIVTGVMFDRFFRNALISFHQSLLTGYWANQVNTYMLYPGGVSAWLVGDLLARFFFHGALESAIYFALGVLVFGLPVSVPGLPGVLLILLVSVLPLAGLGLIGASTFNLLNAKNWGANPVEWLVGFAVTLLSGVYFPPTVLPGPLRALGEWLPQTHALRAARLVLTGQATLADPMVGADLGFLLLFAVLALPLGAWLFTAGMHRALREGTLTRWS
jgi:ABC-2 type transport system permease protein